MVDLTTYVDEEEEDEEEEEEAGEAYFRFGEGERGFWKSETVADRLKDWQKKVLEATDVNGHDCLINYWMSPPPPGIPPSSPFAFRSTHYLIHDFTQLTQVFFCI